MNQDKFLEWLRMEIERADDEVSVCGTTNDSYECGYLEALKQVENIVHFGTFEEVIYVHLKNNIGIDNLNKCEIYKSTIIDGGKMYEIYIEELDEVKSFNRDSFDIIKIECPYDKLKK